MPFIPAIIANGPIFRGPASDVASGIMYRSGAGQLSLGTLSTILDLIGSAAQGDILYRNGSAWARLGAGISGHFLKTQGAAANPVWAAASASPAGSDTHVQFNDSSAFGGDAGLVFNKTNDTLSVIGSADQKRLILKGHSSQTANLFECQNSAGAILAHITSGGRLSVGSSFEAQIDNAAGNFTIYVAGTVVGWWSNTLATFFSGAEFRVGKNTELDVYTTKTAMRFLTNTTAVAAQVDNNATAGNTRLMIWDVDNGTLERVSVGAADSMGTGFKGLRVPN